MKSLLPRIARITRFALCLALIATTSRLASAEELVGSIPGQLGVEQGAAVYTIPIEVPPRVAPGITDTQPDLAITYNSNGGNGLLGVGFSLSGLSAITRCGQTIAQDGQRVVSITTSETASAWTVNA
uniref:Virulence plasmid B protein n=1 Tax=Candidatus Kentrum sp. DK TaxID=2126562 RepID=A0A450SLU6_9GAMM|nr:MAG: virulence plasmid B protein [Candidatus Kentron sp. DK]